MASPDRQALVQSAIAFLVDQKTQSSPFAQRIQFLEAKGLTPAEIEDALRQSATNQAIYRAPYTAGYESPHYANISQQRQPWDWRDYFITAVISGSVMYGAVSLARKYLLPHLRPPTSTVYEADKDALIAQFDAAEALLKEIHAETSSVRQAVEEQKAKVDQTTLDVEAAVKEMREGEVRSRDEMREIRDEINSIREMLPKMIEKNKESQGQSLAELQQELKSLKALLLSRGPPSTPSTGLSGFAPRPSIPSWQLAGGAQSDTSGTGTAPPASTGIPVPVASPRPPDGSEKGT